MVDTTNDLKALDVSGLTCRNLVNFCDHYKVWGSTNNKQNSLVDLASAIIDPYDVKMKDERKKDKNVGTVPGIRDWMKNTSSRRPRTRTQATRYTKNHMDY
ncbi:putative ubiquitin-conjugating enzyme E2 26 [Hordeum vulgare]|nr:putative ubiquitin-conjugating enzyme E2 26 [Hordeum vulgare]